MIIECINCNKIFDVNSELIPSKGRTIQCGSCGYVWFFNPSNITENESQNINPLDKHLKKTENSSNKQKFKKSSKEIKKKVDIKPIEENKKNYEITKYQPKYTFSFYRFFSYTLVLIISFIALIIVIDTFKTPIYEIFPNLEIKIYSLYEVLKDIELFIKDLIEYD